MFKKGVLFLLSVIVSVISAKRLYQDETTDEAMLNPDLFQGDIVGLYPLDKNGVVGAGTLWPKGRVPYLIAKELEYQIPNIQAAMQHIANNSCIQFVPRTDELYFVRIYAGKGCYSNVGRDPRRDPNEGQPLSLGDGCYRSGVIVHELLHTIGFHHEHCRSDRDKYLDIHYENIQKGNEIQFEKLHSWQNRLLTPFDYDSVMLYGERVFSKNYCGGLKTMTAKNGSKLKDIIYKPGLSKSDKIRLNMLYNCK